MRGDEASGEIEAKRQFPLSLSERARDTVRLSATARRGERTPALDMQSLTFVDALMVELKRVSQDDSAI